MNLRRTLPWLLLLAPLAAQAQWVHRTDVGSPGQRTAHALAYDRDRGVTVFFGGEIGASGQEAYFDDTWEYDGLHWRQITIVGPGPDNRSGHAMCYDTVRHEILLCGGVNEDGFLNDCWAYHHTGPDQGTWSVRPHLPNLYYGGGIAGHAMTFDESAGRAVVAGGTAYYDLWADLYGTGLIEIRHIFSFDGTSWTSAGLLPENRSRHAMTYDRHLGRAVLFGGAYLGSPRPDDPLSAWDDFINDHGRYEWASRNLGDVLTLEVDAAPEHLLANGNFLWPTQQSAMVYDEDRDRLVIFGGQNEAHQTYAVDTLELRPNPAYAQDPVWYPASRVKVYQDEQTLQLPVHPPGRVGHAMIYDTRRHTIVMMGGASGGTRYDDTWELPSAPSTGPVWLDAGFTGANFGSETFPYANLAEALHVAATVRRELWLRGPRTSHQQGTFTVTAPVTLRAIGGPVTFGQP